MLVLSFAFHVAIFSVILFVPEQIPTRRIRSTIYEVNLVEMPSRKPLRAKESAQDETGKSIPSSKKSVPAKLISGPKKKERPVVIAKRVVKTKRQKAKKSELSKNKLIDKAVSRVESKVKAEKKDRIEQAISKLESRVKGAGGKEFTGNLVDRGIPFRMYKMDVESKIKNNWAYPVALLGPRSEKNLEAVVVVRVRNNGSILKSWFQKRSSSVIFDLSVLKAVERSDPLPPFPEGYRKTYDEMEINFNLRDLEKY